MTREQFGAMRAKGLSVEQIVAFERGQKPVAATATPAPKRQPWAVRNLPDLAAAPLGFIPGPVGAGLSAIAGMVGKGAQMGMTGERSLPRPPIGYAGNPLASLIPPQVMQEGVKQGALGFTGLGAGKVVAGVGKAAYRGALRPTVGMLRRFPQMVDDMMRQRVPLGAAGEPVVEKKLGEALSRQGVALDAAEMAGAQVPTGPAVASARKLIERVRGSGLKVNQRVRVLEKELNTFIRENAPNLTPNQANELVRALQEEVESVFAAKQTGTLIKGGQRLVTKMQARIEGEMRKALRQAVPGIEKAKRATQAAMAAKEGVAHSKTNIGKGVPARVPVIPTVARAVIPDELRGIELWSRLGLGMNHPALQAMLRQLPRGAAAAFGSGTMPPDTLNNGR